MSASGLPARSAAVPGTYLLVLELGATADIVVGRLGPHTLPKGWYVYVGSALGGVRQRVARHLRVSPVRHWHIDYLRGIAPVREVAVVHSDARLECAVAGEMQRSAGAAAPIAGFGSSDCACGAHLFHFRRRPTRSLIEARLSAAAPGQQISWWPAAYYQYLCECSSAAPA